jgi:DNA-binding FadR family transcriptional regulator
MVLEVRGLIRSRDRSGVVVLDPERHASLSVWPLLVRHGRETPTFTLRLLNDVFATRRTLAVDVVRTVLTGDRDAARQALQPEITAFVAATTDGTHSPRALCTAEHDLLRTVLLVAKRPAVLGILNGIERVVSASDDLVEVLYRDPSAAAQAWSSLLMLLDHPDPAPLLPLLESALTLADEAAIDLVRSFFPASTSPESP